jgi:thiol:disulfide interchange protein
MKILFKTILVLWYCLGLAQANPIKLENTTADLLSEVKQIQPGNSFWIVLRLTMKPGWHTYWLNPGDSGMPTQIDWILPEGFQASPIHWLAPDRIPFGKLVNFGYSNESFHLVEITPPKDLSGQPQTLTAKASWLVCEETCIPESADISLTLPVLTTDQAPEISEHQPLIQQLRSELPQTFDGQATYTLSKQRLTLTLQSPVFQQLKPKSIIFYPQEKGIMKNAPTQPWKHHNQTIEVEITRDFVETIGNLKGIIQIDDDQNKKILNYQIEALSSHPPALNHAGMEGFMTVLLFAFLGGLILNLMPCVFPILSLKALSITKKRDGISRQVRWQGYAYTLGVILSFLGLAVILIGLQQAGHAVGWGFQMQSPLFVGAMAYLMFMIGLSLSGFVYFPVISGFSIKSSKESHPFDSFWVGILAVLVATPCTAPFMGIAIGYTIAQPALIIMTVFLALALGFAAPYLLISLSATVRKILPKPGLWMETLKEFLAFPMYATVIWLLWVLIQQQGSRGFLIVSSGLLLIPFSIWLYRQLTLSSFILRLLALLSLTIISLSPLTHLTKEHPLSLLKIETFSPSVLAQLQHDSKPVFVNATAAWCITCKFNEFVLKSDPVIQAMVKKGIHYLEADWTNQDPEITAFLKSFERSGVPLYVFYPSKGKPVILPQILTESSVLEVLSHQPDLTQ